MNRSDVLLDDVVEQLPVGTFALDADGRVLVWNSAAERLTGIRRERVLGRHVTDGPFDGPSIARILDELHAGRPIAGRVPMAALPGNTLYFRATPGGPSIVGIIQDVADASARDESFALLDALWETAPLGLAYFDLDLRYRRINGAVLDINGGTGEDRLGRTLEEVHGATGAVIADELRAVIADGRPRLDVPIQGRLWHGRGPFQEWRVNVYPVHGPDGQALGVGVVLVDVTTAERTRRELAEVAAQREQALDRYQSLVEATSAAVWIRTAEGAAVQDAPGLRSITGQSVVEHQGWGFLDPVHPEQRDEFRRAWQAAVAADPPTVFTSVYRLRTAQGRYRWFRTRAVPVLASGRVAEWVGTETDIDDEVAARHRLDVLARATLAVNTAMEPEAELTALADALVPDFADVCRVYLVDPGSGGAGRGSLVGRRSVTRTAPGVRPSPASDERFLFPADHPLARAVHAGTPVLLDLPVPPQREWPGAPDVGGWASEIGVSSMLVAPVHSGSAVVAALLFISCGDRNPYTHDDLALVGELAVRASTAVEHAAEFQQNRQVALALQSAMMTEPPTPPGFEVQARYLPAAAELEVGGDWYDAFELPGGDLALGVGDVAGHDLPAAATMGQLRSMLRALAYDAEGEAGEPSAVLRRLDRVASRLAVTRFTTLLYGRLRRCGDRAVFRWSNAGHPPPVLVAPDGEVRLLTGDIGVVLGVDPTCARRDMAVDLLPGATLLLYTDGLAERRRDPLDRATTHLLELVRAGVGLPLVAFCDHLVHNTSADTGDDLVVLAVRLPAR